MAKQINRPLYNLSYEDAERAAKNDNYCKWTGIQRYLAWWGRVLWKNNDPSIDRSVPNSLHMRDEAHEVCEAIEKWKLLKGRNAPEQKVYDAYNEIRLELADVAQFAYDIASDLGIDLNQAMLDKMHINIHEREWEKPDKQGKIKHKKKVKIKPKSGTA